MGRRHKKSKRIETSNVLQYCDVNEPSAPYILKSSEEKMSEIIILKYPLPLKTENGQKSFISEITMERMKVKHLKLIPKTLFEAGAAGKTDPTEFIPLIAGLTGLSEETVSELDVQEDLFQIIQRLESFFGQSPSPTTGVS